MSASERARALERENVKQSVKNVEMFPFVASRVASGDLSRAPCSTSRRGLRALDDDAGEFTRVDDGVVVRTSTIARRRPSLASSLDDARFVESIVSRCEKVKSENRLDPSFDAPRRGPRARESSERDATVIRRVRHVRGRVSSRAASASSTNPSTAAGTSPARARPRRRARAADAREHPWISDVRTGCPSCPTCGSCNPQGPAGVGACARSRGPASVILKLCDVGPFVYGPMRS